MSKELTNREKQKIYDKCEYYCVEHSIPITPFNIITTSLTLGLLIVPRKSEEDKNDHKR